ncbi:MAG: hypothetical protein JO227_12395 [Acetobacteraceae bacterium]|nr:hypothetical protein [Acetobacteraceae bacterium]
MLQRQLVIPIQMDTLPEAEAEFRVLLGNELSFVNGGELEIFHGSYFRTRGSSSAHVIDVGGLLLRLTLTSRTEPHT